MKAAINDFLLFNDKGDVSDSTLWETFKVVVRGKIIAYESIKKKEMRKRLAEIELQLSAAERIYTSSLSTVDLYSVMKLKYEYNTILSEQVNKQILKLKQKHFELSDKPGKLLARQLRGAQANRSILKLKSSAGDVLTDPRDINNHFRDHFEKLYTSKQDATDDEIESFLLSVGLPKINESARSELDSAVTINEIKEAINSLSSGKAAGPDGFCAEFFKAYRDLVAPLLLRMVKHSIDINIFPQSFYEANICLLPKKGKDEMDPSAYRPLSLLNYDQKVVAKIISSRLARHMHSVIHPDQNGFLAGRFSFFNSRRLFNIMYAKYKPDDKPVVISLDAERAFDQIDWRYMHATLRHYGFGDSFLNMIKMLYAAPTSSVLTNGNRSSSFKLQRGTRQGCCTSSLLFNLVLEPLAISIRKHLDIKGIKVGNVECKLSLYADDLLIFMMDPSSSLPPLLSLIKRFGMLSGYSINWQKSAFIPLTNNLDRVYLESLPFQIATDRFTYLGLSIPLNSKSLFKHNFTPLIDKLKTDIEYWRSLPLSMIGRINAIKMVSLPRFMYLFQNIPIMLSSSFFKNN